MPKRQKGGEVQPFPASFYSAARSLTPVDPGQDLVKTGGELVRNFLPRFGAQGGNRRNTRRRNTRRRNTRRRKGGFIPSVMEPFSVATSKYIAPIAMFAAYKFMTKNKKKTRRSH